MPCVIFHCPWWCLLCFIWLKIRRYVVYYYVWQRKVSKKQKTSKWLAFWLKKLLFSNHNGCQLIFCQSTNQLIVAALTIMLLGFPAQNNFISTRTISKTLTAISLNGLLAITLQYSHITYALESYFQMVFHIHLIQIKVYGFTVRMYQIFPNDIYFEKVYKYE